MKGLKMEQLQVSDVAPIYQEELLNVTKSVYEEWVGGQLPSGLDLCVFDFGVILTEQVDPKSIYKKW